MLQFTGNLTGRQAAGAGRGRLDWKYCPGLELADEGFGFSVLSGFRERLAGDDEDQGEGLERVIFGRLPGRLKELGLAGAGARSGLIPRMCRAGSGT